MAKKVFHQIPGFPGWNIAVVHGRRSERCPTGYAILKQDGRDDCMIVHLMGNGELIYVAMIFIAYVCLVLNAYRTLSILFKEENKFTVTGKLWDGHNRTLGMASIHEFSGDTVDPHWYPHHPDGDPTNDLDVIPVNQSVHGLFHKYVHPDTTSEEIEQIARFTGDENFIRYYSSRENWGKYSPKTYDMCEEIHKNDFFGGMSQEDYDKLMHAIGNEFCK